MESDQISIKEKTMKKTIIKSLISFSLLVFLFTKVVSFSEVLSTFTQINLGYFLLALVFIFGNNFVSTARWKYLIDHAKVKYWYLFRLYFIVNYFNNFLPSSIGGDVYKILKLKNVVDDGALATAATFMERFTGLLALAVMASIALTFTSYFPSYYGILMLILFVGGFLCGLFVLNKFHKLHPKLEKFYIVFSSFKDKKMIVFKAFLLSFLVQMFSVLTQFMVIKALGINLSLIYAFFAFPVAGFISFFPISFNGVGVQEAMYIKLLGFVGVSASAAVTASITYFIIRVISSLVGAVFYYFYND